jgi:hypothetical protein
LDIDTRNTVTEAWVDCVRLFHDALFSTHKIDKFRANQLKRIVKDVKTNKALTEKNLKNRFKFHLINTLQQFLISVYGGQKNINAYNDFIEKDSLVIYYCKELMLTRDKLKLTEKGFAKYKDFNMSGLRGPQELSIHLIGNAVTAGSVGMGRSVMLKNVSVFKAIFWPKNIENRDLEYQRLKDSMRDPLEELNQLNKIFYKAQWFAKNDHELADLELKLIKGNTTFQLNKNELLEALTHLRYETQMFFSTPAMFSNNSDPAIKNAALESFAMHMRNLCSFFDFFGNKFLTDITLSDFQSHGLNWQKPDMDITDKDFLFLQFKRANKQVAHLTKDRLFSANPEWPWDLGRIVNLLQPTITSFDQKVKMQLGQGIV